MISVDRVYKTVLTLANSDIRGNVTPSELKLVLNDVVNEVYEGYLAELNRMMNRENRGLIGRGLENLPDRIREKLQYFLTEANLTYQAPLFNFPSNLRYVDSIYYDGDAEVESSKNALEFKTVCRFTDTAPTVKYPIYIRKGNSIQVAPALITSKVTIWYLRNPLIANWTYVVVNGAELFDPSKGDFRDIDLHPSEENTVVLMALLRFGINLKEQDLQAIVQNKDTQDFQQENSN
jgi:hypothetical protein